MLETFRYFEHNAHIPRRSPGHPGSPLYQASFPFIIPRNSVRLSPFIKVRENRKEFVVIGESFTNRSYGLDEGFFSWLHTFEKAREQKTLSHKERDRVKESVNSFLLLTPQTYEFLRGQIFKTVDLEIAAVCNAACVFCPRHELAAGRGVGLMKPALFDTLCEMLQNSVKLVGFCGLGEPTLNKNILTYMRKFKKKGAEIVLVTNGSLLSDSMAEAFLSIPLSLVNISFTGIDGKTYEENMINLNYQESLLNVERFLARVRGKIPVVISSVKTENNQRALAGTAEFWKSGNARADVVDCHSRGGTRKGLRNRSGIKHGRCGLFNSRTFIAWDGRFLSCCHDVTGETLLGKVGKDSLDAIIDKKMSIIASADWFRLCHRCDEPSRFSRLDCAADLSHPRFQSSASSQNFLD